MPFPTRMTSIRRAGDKLFIHSPTPLVCGLKREIEGIGAPRWIVGPNRIPYWWISVRHAAFPDAEVYRAPRSKDQAGNRIDFDTLTLDRDPHCPFSGEIFALSVKGSYMTEVEFFHRASRRLIGTDLIEAIEPQKLGLAMRWLTRLAGVQHPDGQMPRDLRLTCKKTKREPKSAVKTMIGGNPSASSSRMDTGSARAALGNCGAPFAGCSMDEVPWTSYIAGQRQSFFSFH